jgi:hypothetical protein
VQSIGGATYGPRDPSEDSDVGSDTVVDDDCGFCSDGPRGEYLPTGDMSTERDEAGTSVAFDDTDMDDDDDDDDGDDDDDDDNDDDDDDDDDEDSSLDGTTRAGVDVVLESDRGLDGLPGSVLMTTSLKG